MLIVASHSITYDKHKGIIKFFHGLETLKLET